MIKSLYIHIPFCDSICPYCDFHKRVSDVEHMEVYSKALIKEIDLLKDSFSDLETIYIGGGTPTAYVFLEDLLIKLNECIDMSKIKEFTIESAPYNVLRFKDIYNKYNVNRISIGVESLNPETIGYIKRSSNTYKDLKYIMKELRRSGIKNINLDFIYGLPFESTSSIKKELREIKHLNPNHVSFYDLILEEKTILYLDNINGKVTLPNEDLNIKMRDLIEKRLERFGYHKYEISNYARNGYESIHNLAYWNLDNYLGIGTGAHSLIDNERFNNTYNLSIYNNFSDISELRCFYEVDREKEYFLMGLRKVEGVSISKYSEMYNSSMFEVHPELNDFINNGLLEINGDYLRFTKNGIHLGNQVFKVFV